MAKVAEEDDGSGEKADAKPSLGLVCAPERRFLPRRRVSTIRHFGHAEKLSEFFYLALVHLLKGRC